jgi:hypothetical protein
MVQTSSSECTIHIVEPQQQRPTGSGEFKPLTSGQLLLKTRQQQRRALLDDDADCDQDDGAGSADVDPDRECFLSKFLAASMTLLVCGFIYFVVLQRWLLRG